MLFTKLLGSIQSKSISYVGGKVGSRPGYASALTVPLSGLIGGNATAPAAGDIVIVTICIAAQSTYNISITGYTRIQLLQGNDSGYAAYQVNTATLYKVMGSTPDSTVTIPSTGSSSNGQAWTIQVFRGVDNVTPMDVTPACYVTGSVFTHCVPNPPPITPLTAGAWIVVCGAGATNLAKVYTAAYLTNFISTVAADNFDAVVGAGYYSSWVTGSYNPGIFGGVNSLTDTSSSWGATTIALRPAS